MSTEEKNRSINPQLHDEKSDCERQAVVPIAKLEKSLGMTEETSQSKQCRKPNLFLEIPTRPLELPPQEFVQIDMPLTPTPTRKMVTQDKLPISRSWSFSKIFTPRVNRTSSLPVPPLANSNPDSNHGGSINSHLNTKEVRKISRSLSVPVINKEKGIQRMNSFFRVIPSTPRAKEDDSEVSMATKGDDENNESNGEDIPEEEAVCRICFVELCEGGETLKMECSCKGELALAHQECAVKWFAIKGNKTCDICKQEVRNLPVTLLRIQSAINRNTRPTNFGEMEFNGYRQVRKMDTSAIAISVPFSCALGLLSSVHVQAVVSILLSTFAGFGVAMSGASILVEVLRWRERHSVVINQNAISNAPPPSLIATPSYNSPRPHRGEVENPGTFSGS
ncbi:hypothetical protein DH2020_000167 [Rehmannia glutinosa]|uniref:RING-CH-type domain-containing protein n=1 Tax=Rehmannia glutinosa TaxID=99300 RepID=A0ABR0XW64_REHGL